MPEEGMAFLRLSVETLIAGMRVQGSRLYYVRRGCGGSITLTWAFLCSHERYVQARSYEA